MKLFLHTDRLIVGPVMDEILPWNIESELGVFAYFGTIEKDAYVVTRGVKSRTHEYMGRPKETVR